MPEKIEPAKAYLDCNKGNSEMNFEVSDDFA